MNKKTSTTVGPLEPFAALDPFFRAIEKGLEGLADGGHFFDLLAEDAVFEYVITVPGYPRRIVGRAAVADLYRPYGTILVLDRCDLTGVHRDAETGVVVLEYESQGRVVASGRPYANRYVSVIALRERKVVDWRGYLGPGGGVR